MILEIKNESLIRSIITSLEDDLAEAVKDAEKVAGYHQENESLYKEIEELRERVEEYKRDVSYKTAEADRLKEIERRYEELVGKNTEAWSRITKQEAELECLQKENTTLKKYKEVATSKHTEEEVYLIKKTNKDLENRVDELMRENLKLSRIAKRIEKETDKKNTPGEVIGELMKEIKRGRPKKSEI
ncbi:MAG: hypothetical protein ACRCU6_12235 [Fusobacteriaceae bacterium]